MREGFLQPSQPVCEAGGGKVMRPGSRGQSTGCFWLGWLLSEGSACAVWGREAGNRDTSLGSKSNRVEGTSLGNVSHVRWNFPEASVPQGVERADC